MLSLLLTVTASLASPGDTWVQDFDRGLELAREAKKDVLVDFTGSDWCSWCKKLKREVFRQEAFLAGVADDYVLVMVDLPRTHDALDQVPDIDRNRELSQQYQVSSFPTVLLMTADGEVYGRTGYQEGGAVPYLAHLAELRRAGREPLLAAKALGVEFAAADEEAKPALAARALALYPKLPNGSPGGEHLLPLLAHYLVLDPQNEKAELAPALKLLLGSTKATPEQIALARELDPKNEFGLLEYAVFASAFWAANPDQQRVAAADIVALHALGPIRERKVAKILYPYGALWSAMHLNELETAKELARLGLPYVEKNRGMQMQLRTILRKR